MNAIVQGPLIGGGIPYENMYQLQLLSKVRKLTYANCEYLWSYVGKVLLITRNLLNAAARSSSMEKHSKLSRRINNLSHPQMRQLQKYQIVTIKRDVASTSRAPGNSPQ